MSKRHSQLRVVAVAGFLPVPSARMIAAWSRPISTRADRKLAPCMARPNLFSGD